MPGLLVEPVGQCLGEGERDLLFLRLGLDADRAGIDAAMAGVDGDDEIAAARQHPAPESRSSSAAGTAGSLQVCAFDQCRRSASLSIISASSTRRWPLPSSSACTSASASFTGLFAVSTMRALPSSIVP